LDELNKYQADDGVQNVLEQISDNILIAEYGKAWEILDDFLKGIGNR